MPQDFSAEWLLENRDSGWIQRRAEGACSTVTERIRRALKISAGFTVLLIGIVMIVAPGPALIVIPAGLAILATEFRWARRILVRFKFQIRAWGRRWRASRLRAKLANIRKGTRANDSSGIASPEFD
jgi:uncharacterized protein (TIGR02611 family)